jgi:hypothetical protein
MQRTFKVGLSELRLSFQRGHELDPELAELDREMDELDAELEFNRDSQRLDEDAELVSLRSRSHRLGPLQFSYSAQTWRRRS